MSSKSNLKLKPLEPGDLIDIVAPASACTRSELTAAVKLLRKSGYVPRVPREILRRTPLFSNVDEVRLKQLKEAVQATDSQMIWCLRGGYGSIRLLEEMKKWSQPKRAKIFLGFSDITTLHSFFNERWHWPTLHGPLFTRFGSGLGRGREMQSLWDILEGKTKKVRFHRLKKINRTKTMAVSGVVKGGNMAVLQSGLGTEFALKPKGSILFFEDVGEKPHRVDRMFTQFAQAGWFDEAKAVVLGRFLNENARDRSVLWNDVVPRFAASVGIPVFKGLPVGHDPKLQMTLPLGVPGEISTRGELEVSTGMDV